ncbi:MAG: RluA family pseudouridine synthase, partial [Deltaproteobacteria bacterium]|nr:RluA family pseudouridine synthase [Deltaproteobacteria bacterium]
SFGVEDNDRDKRIDVFLTDRIEALTRNRVQDLIKRGNVRVNNSVPKTSYRVKKCDHVFISIPPVRPYHLDPEPVDFTLIHEDSSLIVVNKPPGLVIHPAPGHATGTLVHGLLEHCKELSGIGGVLRPGIVHRLDKDTSGVMVVAKNDRVHQFLSEQFRTGTLKKKYVALVHGIPRANEGEIDLPISRHPKKRKQMSVAHSGGKQAITRWRKMTAFGDRICMLSVTPKTGRTHQIRVHLSYIGHPVVGDPVYGHKHHRMKQHFDGRGYIPDTIKRQMLHAETLGFVHPDREEYCEFEAPVPHDMEQLIEKMALCLKN